MEDGYYWYFSTDDDWMPLRNPEPQIVQLFEDSVCVADISLNLDEAHGVFVGPLIPPPDPRAEHAGS